MDSFNNNESFVWRNKPVTWILFIASSIIVLYVYYDGFIEMLKNWNREEYSHGYMIPFITAFMVWQKTNKMEVIEFKGSWIGVGLIIIGMLLHVIGNYSAVSDIIAYGLVLTIFGLILSYVGIKAYKEITIPLLLLVFMIPLPDFLYASFSNNLQLLSSKIGVEFIRLFDISVYLEGNVIDLGVYKLQVVEACSGLRYLFPLVTLGFIAAYFYKVETWKRVVVFASTIPITVLMNSLRIGIIGVTVEYWGIEMAEGILHDFEGWFVFMTCIAVLLIIMALLTRIGRDNRPLVEVFGLELPDKRASDITIKMRPIPVSFVVGVFTIFISIIIVNLMPERVEVIPMRKSFTNFPTEIENWNGSRERLEAHYINALNFDDYILSNYTSNEHMNPVGLYVGYYAFQRADKVPHSPRACLPGGGWAITSISNREIKDVIINNTPLRVNRVIIEKGEHKQLVYYWFQQRDRIITSEWMVKYYLFVDSFIKSRTDGALIRLTTLLKPNENIQKADARLESFALSISNIISEYVPN